MNISRRGGGYRLSIGFPEREAAFPEAAIASALTEILGCGWCVTEGHAARQHGHTRIDSPEKHTIGGQLFTGSTSCEVQLSMW